jgi:hypothetical protein
VPPLSETFYGLCCLLGSILTTSEQFHCVFGLGGMHVYICTIGNWVNPGASLGAVAKRKNPIISTSGNWTWSHQARNQVTQLVSKFPAFCGTRRFITMFTRARHWSLSWARCIHSTPSHPVSLRHILILSSHVYQGLPSGFFRFSNQELLCISHLSHACYMPHTSHPPWLYHRKSSVCSLCILSIISNNQWINCSFFRRHVRHGVQLT